MFNELEFLTIKGLVRFSTLIVCQDGPKTYISPIYILKKKLGKYIFKRLYVLARYLKKNYDSILLKAQEIYPLKNRKSIENAKMQKKKKKKKNQQKN
jgi:hypothetical protein